MVIHLEKDKRTALIVMYHIYIYMIHGNQGSPFVLFIKDYKKDCFWILFLRKGFGIRRGVMVIHLEKDKRTALIVMYHIYIYMIHDNQGSPFVLFKKDYNKDCFWILFLRKGLSIRRGVMVIHLEKDCNKDSFWILFLRKGLGIRRGVMGIHLEKDCNKDSFWILFLRKGFGIRRGVGALTLE